jgi:acyl-CoA hydrolase
MTLSPKPPRASRLIINQLMLPEHANTHGNVHGGWIMKLVDEAGGMCATRHSRRPCVTVSIDSMTFKEPVHVGELLELTAEITWTGRTSIEVTVNVVAENLLTGDRIATNSAFLVYVALDDRGRPTEVPPLTPETESEIQRFADGQKRQELRKKVVTSNQSSTY